MHVSIVGITGYSGLELLRLALNHPRITVASIHATKEIGKSISDIFPHLKGICDLKIEPFNSSYIMNQSDLVFFATPSGVAKNLSRDFVEANFPVIDLSGDHRLSTDLYKNWYHKTPVDKDIQTQFVYGLAEFTDLNHQKFIANPGCYATATELALIPLIKNRLIDIDSIIVDAKSGLSGAGKALSNISHYVNVNNNYTTYKLNAHQHIPEIIQALKIFNPNIQNIQFSTSLLPLNRGIVATIYCRLNRNSNPEDIRDAYLKIYEDKPFVRIKESIPELHDVVGSNYTDIGFQYNKHTQVLTIVSVIDNLIKGAAGQALQNLNLMYGFNETEGLESSPFYL
ncbi:N-acetyl-gamma-glutamyl-phosphate reductase [Staphylococcus caprae]